MAARKIIIKNYKDASFKRTNLNQIFDPEGERGESYELGKSTISAPGLGGQTYVAFHSIAPGKSDAPAHHHNDAEEICYIASGKGVLETREGEIEVSEGDAIVIPPGEGGSHRLRNRSDGALIYLTVSVRIAT